MRSTKNNYHLKFKDKIVDAAANSQFIFNKTPILVPVLKQKEKIFDQNKKVVKRDRPNKQNHDEDQLNVNQKKKRKNSQESKNLLQAQMYTPLESDLYSYFRSTKITCKNIESVPKPKYQIGTLVLTAICDRGIGGKYIVTNFSRNKKGYIDYKQLNSQHDPTAIQHYKQPGEFIIAQVIKGENLKNVQLKLTELNKSLNEKQIRVGQIIPGQIKSKQELGCHIDVGKKYKFKYFLPKDSIQQEQYEELLQNKFYIFKVVSIDIEKKFVKLGSIDNEQNFNFRGIEQDDLSKFDLEPYLFPGHKVNVMILKKLKNGVLVKFLKIFYGYIFIDHLVKKIDQYNVGDKMTATIIHNCNNPPTIYLSQKHTFEKYQPKYELYNPIKKPEDMQQIQGVFFSKSENIMIHTLHMHTDLDHLDKLWIKENNYFDKYQIASSKKLGLRVGQLSKNIPFQNFKLYGKGTGKFRVMCLDVWNKVLKVSYDPLIIKSKQKQLGSVDDINPLNQYVGFISTISENGVIVQFQNSIKGLLNNYQIKQNGIDILTYKVGSGIQVYVKESKKEGGLLELKLNLTKKQAKRKASAASQDSGLQDGVKMGLIHSINSKSIKPIYVRINKKLIALSIFKNIAVPEDLQKVLPFEDKFKINERVKIYTKNKQFYLYPHQQLTNPNLKICRIVGLKSPYARIQTDKDKFGSVHISQISDMILPNPILTELKLGEYRVCRKLDQENYTLRQSIVKFGVPKDIKECITKYSESQKNGDYRNRMLVIPDGNGLKPGMLFFGYVKSTNKNGCFISINKHYEIRVELNELSDDKIIDPIKQFYENKLVFGRLITQKIKINEPNKKLFDGSLRESVVKFGYQLNLDTFRVGLTIQGKVCGYTKGNALVAIQGSKYRGIISAFNYKLAKQQESLEKTFPLGMKLTCKIIAYEQQPKLLIKLSTLDKHFKQYADVKTVLQNVDSQRTQNLLDSLKQLNKKYQTEVRTKEVKQIQLQQNQDDQDAQYNRVMKLLEEKGFNDKDDQEEEAMQIQKQQPHVNNNQLIEQEQEIEDQDSNQDQQGSKSYQDQVLQQGQNKQNNNFNQYKSQITKLPYPSSHYQSLLLSSPSFETHLMYISSLLTQKQPEQIRQQFLRSINSLKTIEDKENMWIAWINMQKILGDLMGAVKKAIQNGVGAKVYFRVIQILIQQTKWDVAIQFSRTMVKKWSANIKVWINFLKTIILYRRQHNLPQNLLPKEILRRSAQSLQSKQQVLLESHYGQLEYQFGEAEQGRNIFENIITRYPKRTDIWSVYIDMETKYGQKQKSINIFERALSLKLKNKKMKFFFKKYLKYMEQHGTPKDTQKILKRAKEYAEQNINLEQESEEEEQQAIEM